MSWQEFETDVRRLRPGVVTMLKLPGSQAGGPRDVADVVAKAAGYKPIGQRWRLVSKDAAFRIVTLVLERDLAHDGVLMPVAEAQRLATRFLEDCGANPTFLTNGTWEEPRESRHGTVFGPSWEPLTQATFDAGVLAVCDTHAAMLWVEDED